MDLVARSSPGLGANTDLAARSSWLESNFQNIEVILKKSTSVSV